MWARYGCFRLSIWMVFVGLTGLSVEAAPLRQTHPEQRFHLTERGLQLQQRSGVPISGVVLYEPIQMERGFSLPLDDAGPNARCNQDAFGNRQNEITAAASPANMNNVLTGSNDYRNGDASGGFYRSTNGAASFSDALVTRGPAGVFDAAGDPVAAVDNNGKMFASYIAFDRNTPDNGIYVQISTDDGASWSSPVAVVAHTGGGNADFEDKPYACCDYSPGSPNLNNYYITWTKFTTTGSAPIYFSRSTNGGASFGAPVQISSSGNTQFSCPTVGPNGEVYAVWFDYNSSTIKFDKSTNAGSTWGADITVASFNDNFPANPCGTWRQAAYPVIACDISSSPRHGWLYVSWVSNTNGNPDVFFSRSTNGGTSWSAATRVDDDGTGRWQWFHWMACHPTTGDLGVAWLDRREDPANCSYKEYATISTDGGTTWAANFAVANVASNPSSSNFMGDYCGATFRSDGFYGGWTDMRNDDSDCYAAWFRNPVPTITVLSPNGSETWIAGESNTITWASANLNENVKLELNRSFPGPTWETVIASTPNDGTHPWLVTLPTTTTARIRISGTVNTTVKDTSNANFTIGARAITVLYPNGGEVFTTGNSENLTWTSQNLTGTVNIQLNRAYPGPTWENIAMGTANDGSEPWTVSLPATGAARVRVVSVSFPTVGDSSNANFTIVVPNTPPLLAHDALDDFAPGTGVVTALATDAQVFATVASVKMFYRAAGAGTFDSLALSAIGNPNEFSSSLSFLSAGTYEYFVRAADNQGLTATVPAGAPADLYSVNVNEFCGAELSYDDGSAEHFNYAAGAVGVSTRWAVKFGPVPTPFALCAARFACARTLPTAEHTPVYYAIILADGPGGMPGTLVQDGMTGSIGNVVGGLPAGTNWADVVLRDALGEPLLITASQFYVAVGNPNAAAFESFGRDISGVNSHRSYFYDPCEDLWFSEDDTLTSANAYPGNRLIRASGFPLLPPTVVIQRSGDDVRLFWTSVGAPVYRIYSSSTAAGPFVTLEGLTSDTTFTDAGAVLTAPLLFYQVTSASN